MLKTVIPAWWALKKINKYFIIMKIIIVLAILIEVSLSLVRIIPHVL